MTLSRLVSLTEFSAVPAWNPNLRGVFRFPVEEYAEQLLPSSFNEKTPQWR
jgi:hypothetical protein